MEDKQNVWSKLKLISRLQVGDKINVKYMYIQKDGIRTRLSRMFYDENRRNTLNFVQNTINRAFELVLIFDRSIKQSDKLMSTKIIKDLRTSKTGILNLKETYISDVKFCCDMDTLLQVIDARLEEIEVNCKINSISIPNLSNVTLPITIPSSAPTPIQRVDKNISPIQIPIHSSTLPKIQILD